jgi:hypothetical protein
MKETWQTLQSGKLRRYFADGSRAIVEKTDDGYRWEICLPDGQFPSGTAPTEAAAKTATEKPHDAYVLRQWAKGRLYREGTFRCPLKDWPEE